MCFWNMLSAVVLLLRKFSEFSQWTSTPATMIKRMTAPSAVTCSSAPRRSAPSDLTRHARDDRRLQLEKERQQRQRLANRQGRSGQERAPDCQSAQANPPQPQNHGAAEERRGLTPDSPRTICCPWWGAMSAAPKIANLLTTPRPAPLHLGKSEGIPGANRGGPHGPAGHFSLPASLPGRKKRRPTPRPSAADSWPRRRSVTQWQRARDQRYGNAACSPSLIRPSSLRQRFQGPPAAARRGPRSARPTRAA